MRSKRNAGQGEVKRTDSASVAEVRARKVAKLRTIGVHKLRSHRLQPQERHSDANVSDLMVSIQELGLLEPPMVWKRPDGRYVGLCGHRRVRAWQLLAMEGLVQDRMRVFVRDDLSEGESDLIVAAEYGHRREFSPVHTARVISAAHRAMEAEGSKGVTVRRLAAILPWEKTSIDDYLKIDQALQDPRTEALVLAMDKEGKSLLLKVLSQPRFSTRLRILTAYQKGGVAAVHKALASSKGGRPQKSVIRSKRGQGYDLTIRFRPTMLGDAVDEALEEARRVVSDLEELWTAVVNDKN